MTWQKRIVSELTDSAFGQMCLFFLHGGGNGGKVRQSFAISPIFTEPDPGNPPKSTKIRR